MDPTKFHVYYIVERDAASDEWKIYSSTPDVAVAWRGVSVLQIETSKEYGVVVVKEFDKGKVRLLKPPEGFKEEKVYNVARSRMQPKGRVPKVDQTLKEDPLEIYLIRADLPNSSTPAYLFRHEYGCPWIWTTDPARAIKTSSMSDIKKLLRWMRKQVKRCAPDTPESKIKLSARTLLAEQ